MKDADNALRSEHAAVFQLLSGEYAGRYLRERLVPGFARCCSCASETGAVRSALENGATSFIVLVTHYCVPSKSHESCRFGELAVRALRQTLGANSYVEFLESDDIEALALSYDELAKGSRHPQCQTERELLEGLIELNMDVCRQVGEESLLRWFLDEIRETGRVDHLFERLTAIRNLGPKAASTLLRDVVLLFDLEEDVHFADRLYLQPISSSLRRIARLVVPESQEGRMADWILAGKLAKYARLAGVSGVRFNAGAGYFAAGKTFAGHSLEDSIRRLITSEPFRENPQAIQGE